jgi:methyl-accepting chemotaxis protein
MSNEQQRRSSFLENLRISQRVYIAFGAVLALTIALGAFATDRLDGVNRLSREVGGHWLPQTRELGDLSFQFMRFRMIEAAWLLAPSDAKAAEAQTLKQIESRIEKILAHRSENSGSDAERQENGRLNADWRAYLKLDAQFQGSAQTAASALYRGTMRELSHTVQEEIGGAVNDTVGNADRAVDSGVKIGADARFWIVVAVVTAAALCLTIGWRLSRGLSRPIESLTRTMTSLAGGDFAVTVAGADLGNEIGQMARSVLVFKDNGIERARLAAQTESQRAAREREQSRVAEERAQAAREQADAIESLGAGLNALARGDLTKRLGEGFSGRYAQIRDDFNEAAQKLELTLSTVVDLTQSVQTGVREITSASSDLARRTELQSANLEESSAALREVAEGILATAASSLKTKENISIAKTDAASSAAVVAETIDSITRINGASQQIGAIIGVIDEIAFQTNLLALNAGVEAARAGESGRGFAVVAAEVRALAQRSADAAKQIKTLISSSSEEVANGVRLVGATEQCFSRVNQQVAIVDEGIAEIAGQTVSQSTALKQVNCSISELDQTTQQNAAMAEEATAACEALQRQMDKLGEMVSLFVLTNSLEDGRSELRARAA